MITVIIITLVCISLKPTVLSDKSIEFFQTNYKIIPTTKVTNFVFKDRKENDICHAFFSCRKNVTSHTFATKFEIQN